MLCPYPFKQLQLKIRFYFEGCTSGHIRDKSVGLDRAGYQCLTANQKTRFSRRLRCRCPPPPTNAHILSLHRRTRLHARSCYPHHSPLSCIVFPQRAAADVRRQRAVDTSFLLGNAEKTHGDTVHLSTEEVNISLFVSS